MINPNMPNIPGMPTFPGMGAVTDTLEFVKNLWGGMGIPGMNMSGMNIPGMPGMVVPTLSVEEIRKKISDLKAVETWLELNMSMLRGTIQALEVQAATIATLQSMGDALSATMSSSGGFGQGAQQKPAASSGAYPAGSGQRAAAAPEPSSRDEADAASLTAPLVNAAAWWNLLQDQFRHAVSTAMTAEMPTMPAAAPAKAKTRAESKADSGGHSRGNSESASPPPRKRRSSK
jgi:hypothetical protein